jgi:hypothetical protein
MTPHLKCWKTYCATQFSSWTVLGPSLFSHLLFYIIRNENCWSYDPRTHTHTHNLTLILTHTRFCIVVIMVVVILLCYLACFSFLGSILCHYRHHIQWMLYDVWACVTAILQNLLSSRLKAITKIKCLFVKEAASCTLHNRM